MIPICYVPGEELRSRRELLRHRLNLVKNRTMVKNRIHGLLDKHGLRIARAQAQELERLRP
jgi:transposase